MKKYFGILLIILLTSATCYAANNSFYGTYSVTVDQCGVPGTFTVTIGDDISQQKQEFYMYLPSTGNSFTFTYADPYGDVVNETTIISGNTITIQSTWIWGSATETYTFTPDFKSYSYSGTWIEPGSAPGDCMTAVGTGTATGTVVGVQEPLLFADFPQWGLFSYETPTSSPKFINQSTACMAPHGGKLAVGLAGLGLYLYNGLDWLKIHDSTPRQLVSWNGKLVADFTEAGLYAFDGTSWSYLTKSCLDMCAWNNKLVVSFDDWGLMTYDGSAWMGLTKAPVSMASWGSKLVVNFSDWGLFVFDGLGWSNLSKTAASLTVWDDKLAVSFNDWGLFSYDGSTWVSLSKAPKIMTSWNDDLVVGFDDWGLYLFDGSAWSLLSPACPVIMTSGTIN